MVMIVVVLVAVVAVVVVIVVIVAGSYSLRLTRLVEGCPFGVKPSVF